MCEDRARRVPEAGGEVVRGVRMLRLSSRITHRMRGGES